MASYMSKATTSRVTVDFKHLLNNKGPQAVVLAQARTRNPFVSRSKDIHPENRIKFWNIVPGDKVRLVRGPFRDPERVVEVLSVDKYRNLIHLKDITVGKTDNPNRPQMAAKVQYSNVQLYIGKREFPTLDEEGKPLVRDVFATRLYKTVPRFNPALKQWVWKRYAASTYPSLPEIEASRGRRRRRDFSNAISIPWPKVEKPEISPPTSYDTDRLTAAKRTWKPIAADLNPLTRLLLPRGQSATSIDFEHVYIRSLLNPYRYNTLPSLPMERYLEEELSNPHSRAKKQKRWQAANEAKLELRTQMIRAEMGDLRGRKRAVARREAIFRWNAKVKQDEKDRKYDRWVKRGGLEDEEKNKKRKAKKAIKLDRQLRSVVFALGQKNQVVPGVESTLEQ